MKIIVYAGPAFSGKGTSVRAVARGLGAQLTTEAVAPTGEILAFRASTAHGPVELRTVPGFVFEDAARHAAASASGQGSPSGCSPASVMRTVTTLPLYDTKTMRSPTTS